MKIFGLRTLQVKIEIHNKLVVHRFIDQQKNGTPNGAVFIFTNIYILPLLYCEFLHHSIAF
jgi:hypothetical protein